MSGMNLEKAANHGVHNEHNERQGQIYTRAVTRLVFRKGLMTYWFFFVFVVNVVVNCFFPIQLSLLG